jgi:hypothetical protein
MFELGGRDVFLSPQKHTNISIRDGEVLTKKTETAKVAHQVEALRDPQFGG